MAIACPELRTHLSIAQSTCSIGVDRAIDMTGAGEALPHKPHGSQPHQDLIVLGI
jgi:hypothetical protein